MAMKILVCGVGAIGSLMTHYLCRAGNDVTIVARSTYEELNRNGLVIRHYLQRRTTVDHPRVVREADAAHYDIVFSVMQGQQQLPLLPTLAGLDTDLLVLVGNNMEAERCVAALKHQNLLFGFQNSAGRREGGTAIVGRMPTTDLVLGGLHSPASPADIAKVRAAFPTKGYKITPIDSMYGYYMCHIAEIMPYGYLCYHIDFDLKRAKRSEIKMIVKATNECFEYLMDRGIPAMPPREDEYYSGGMRTTAMFCLYRIVAKTVLGRLMVSDHCKNGIVEMKYLDAMFNDYRQAHPGKPMPTWDAMRAWGLKAFASV